MVQLSHPYMTTEKTVALTLQTFVCKVLFRFVLAFVPRSNRSNFMAAVTTCSDFRDQEEEICHCFHLLLIHLP